MFALLHCFALFAAREQVGLLQCREKNEGEVAQGNHLSVTNMQMANADLPQRPSFLCGSMGLPSTARPRLSTRTEEGAMWHRIAPVVLRWWNGVVSVMLRWYFDVSSMVLRWFFEGFRVFLPSRPPIWRFRTASPIAASAWFRPYWLRRYSNETASSCRSNSQRLFVTRIALRLWTLDCPPHPRRHLHRQDTPHFPGRPPSPCYLFTMNRNLVAASRQSAADFLPG